MSDSHAGDICSVFTAQSLSTNDSVWCRYFTAAAGCYAGLLSVLCSLSINKCTKH